MATTYSAYAVYVYDSATGHGMAGRIVDNPFASPILSVAADMNTRLNGDPKVEGFIDAGDNLRVAVTDRVAGENQPVYIHDATNGSEVSVPTTERKWPEENLYTLTRLGDYLYGIDYDNARVFEVSASAPYAATGVSYVLDVFLHEGFVARGQALLVVNGELYGLFAFPDSSFENYEKSLLVCFYIGDSGSGRRISVARGNPNLEKNAFSMAYYGGKIYVASIGGMQNGGSYNANSKIQSVTCPDLCTVADWLTTTDFPSEFRDISFDGNGTAYVLAGNYDANWNLQGKLAYTTSLTSPVLQPIDIFPTPALDPDPPVPVYGYFWSAQYTPENARIWYARGNEVWVYNANNQPATLVGTLPMSVLKGNGNYTDLNDLTYVGEPVEGRATSLRGYRSHLQRSNSKFAQAARALTRGRPELTEEEFQQLVAIHGAP